MQWEIEGPMKGVILTPDIAKFFHPDIAKFFHPTLGGKMPAPDIRPLPEQGDVLLFWKCVMEILP